jgi:hypothetical protein
LFIYDPFRRDDVAAGQHRFGHTPQFQGAVLSPRAGSDAAQPLVVGFSVVVLDLGSAEDGVVQLPQGHWVKVRQQFAGEPDQFHGVF